MQDGQNLFDPTTSYAGDWRLGETILALAQRGHEAIVVGVGHARQNRLYEYSPFPDRRLGGGGGDRYLEFLVETVKPKIDREFRTQPERERTSIAGSSMGGLISLYAAHRGREVFGSVAALSPSLWFGGRRLIRFIEAARRSPLPRVYLDIGLAEPAGAVSDVRRLNAVLERRGHRAGSTLSYLEDEGGRHDEATWGRRFGGALAFLTAD
jgi:predicted alpha/beta superfamily hydrolase